MCDAGTGCSRQRRAPGAAGNEHGAAAHPQTASTPVRTPVREPTGSLASGGPIIPMSADRGMIGPRLVGVSADCHRLHGGANLLGSSAGRKPEQTRLRLVIFPLTTSA